MQPGPHRILRIGAAIVALQILIGCGGGGSPGPIATVTAAPIPTATPSATPPSTPTPGPTSTPAGPAAVTVDLNQRFQTISGWEVAARLWEEDKTKNRYDGAWLADRNEILDALVNQAGVTRIRIELHSGAENSIDHWSRFVSGQASYTEWRAHRYEKINDNSDPLSANAAGFQFSELDYQMDNLVMPLRQRLTARGEKLTVNLCYVDFRPDASPGNVDHAHAPAEYAELILAAFQHLASKYGVTPDVFELSLEPENTAGWGGAELGGGLVAAAARLEAAGFHPGFIAPSVSSAGNASSYIGAMLAQAGAASRISAFSYHSYDGPPDSTRAAILGLATQARVTTAMLEHIAADVNELRSDLTVANVSAWQQFGIANLDSPSRDSQGAYLLLVDLAKPAGARVRLASRTRALSQIFRRVRPGAVRVSATGEPSRRPIAFVTPAGKATVAVIADASGPFAVGGLPAGTYGVEYTTDAALAANAADVTVAAGGLAQATLPAAGVLVLYQR